MVRSVPFKYFGKERNLLYDAKAVKAIEKGTGLGIFKLLKILNEDPENISIDLISIILWAGLKHEDSTLNLDKVDQWMTTHAQESDLGLMDTVRLYMEAIGDALIESGLMGKKTEGETDEKKSDRGGRDLDSFRFCDYIECIEPAVYGVLRIHPEDFYRMTPGEIFAMMKGFQRERENQEKLSLFYAWQTGRVAVSFFSENPLTFQDLMQEYDSTRKEEE